MYPTLLRKSYLKVDRDDSQSFSRHPLCSMTDVTTEKVVTIENNSTEHYLRNDRTIFLKVYAIHLACLFTKVLKHSLFAATVPKMMYSHPTKKKARKRVTLVPSPWTGTVWRRSVTSSPQVGKWKMTLHKRQTQKYTKASLSSFLNSDEAVLSQICLV